MITPREIMLGNKLLLKSSVITVTTVDMAGGIDYTYDHEDCDKTFVRNLIDPYIQPITLTPELLENAGFDYIDKYKCVIGNWSFDRSAGGTGLIFHYEHHCNPVSRQVTLVHVHQLQNFFYSLTNKELEIQL